MKYIVAIAALVLAGCDVPPGFSKHREAVDYIVRTVDVEGHKYIIFEGTNKGNIIHSESCPCKEGGME